MFFIRQLPAQNIQRMPRKSAGSSRFSSRSVSPELPHIDSAQKQRRTSKVPQTPLHQRLATAEKVRRCFRWNGKLLSNWPLLCSGGTFESSPAQRQEVPGDDWQGVRSAHSSLKQCPKDTETSEGADVTSQAAKETGFVGKTDKDWPTSLQAIAN